MTDKQIAALLGVSIGSVRQAWDGVFDRCEPILPSADRIQGAHRGPERRRLILEYMGTHMAELRPWRRSGDQTARAD